MEFKILVNKSERLLLNFWKSLIVINLIIIMTNCMSTDPWEHLSQAEKLIEEQKFEEALKRIDKAEKTEFFTCGLGYVEFNKSLNLLKFKVYDSQGKFKDSRNILDSIFIYDHQIDSLKIASYQKEIGKKRFKEIVVKGIEKAIIDCTKDDCYVEIPADNSDYQNIRFKLIWDDELVLYPQISKEEKLKSWKKKFKKSKSFQMIGE